jgi:hypothetical protein
VELLRNDIRLTLRTPADRKASSPRCYLDDHPQTHLQKYTQAWAVNIAGRSATGDLENLNQEAITNQIIKFHRVRAEVEASSQHLPKAF